MTAKNYFFTKGPAATVEEALQNDELGFTFVNGTFGDTFNRECCKVAGLVPKHLKDKEVDLPEVEIPDEEVDLTENASDKRDSTADE